METLTEVMKVVNDIGIVPDKFMKIVSLGTNALENLQPAWDKLMEASHFTSGVEKIVGQDSSGLLANITHALQAVIAGMIAFVTTVIEDLGWIMGQEVPIGVFVGIFVLIIFLRKKSEKQKKPKAA